MTVPNTNTRALGQLLYTHYLYVFQVAGLILLVAMVGAIVLTLRHRSGVKRQKSGVQMARARSQVLQIEKSYWQLVQAQRDVDTLERLVEASEETTNILFHRQQDNTNAVQIQQANAATK